MTSDVSPTEQTYEGLTYAYGFFNDRLFQGALSPCLITMQRHKGAYGYFAARRFGERDGDGQVDEIALNPSHFAERSPTQILSTLVHEMVHKWQEEHGKPGRVAYHNKEWAGKMDEIGLTPSSTGQPGGKRVGQKVSHYIAAGGPFALACDELLTSGAVELRYVERWGEEGEIARKKKAASKTKYTCPTCQANAWAKPAAKLICGECDELMMGEDADDDSA